LVAASGVVKTTPVQRTAARERSNHDWKTELASDCVSLHTPRPSGRNPHRPLFFFRPIIANPEILGIADSCAQIYDKIGVFSNGRTVSGIRLRVAFQVSQEDSREMKKGGWCKPPFYN
jgi:hypothetical protein